MQEYALWLQDLIHHGIGELPNKAKTVFDPMVHRLYDSYAAGLAHELKQIQTRLLPSSKKTVPDWSTQILREFGRHYLLTQAWQHIDQLGPAEQFDCYEALGLLTFDIAAQHTERMRRDGLQPQNKQKRVPYLTQRVTKIVGSTPLDYWTDEIAVDLSHFLELVSLSRWTRTLSSGLATAARRQARTDWAEALIWWGLEGVYEKTMLRNVNLISPEALTALIERSYTEADPIAPLKSGTRLSTLLQAWKRPWPRPAAVMMLQLLDVHLANHHPDKPPDATTKSAVRQFLSFIPPQLAKQARETLSRHQGLHPQWMLILDKGLTTLRHRQALAEWVNTES